MKFQSKCLVLLAAAQSVAATSYSPPSINTSSSPSLSLGQSILANIRGGAVDIIDEETPKKKNKSTKSSKTKGGTATQKTQQPQTETNDDEEAKVAINTAMKESDTAHTLGEAIRARAHILRQDKLPYQERTFDSALVSLGLSLGTAGLDVDLDEEIIGVVSNEEEGTDKEEEVQDAKKSTMMAYYQYGHRIPRYHHQQQQNQQFVQPSTSAVIANYFLKTHGGTHLLQCVLSLLASVLGMICLMLPSFPSSSITTAAAPSSTTTTAKKVVSSSTLSKQILQSTLKYQLLQQTLLIAMTKHISAIVGAVILGAQSIPTLGIRNARYHLEMVALDPVGQYLFYCSILVVWLGWFGGGNGSGGSGGSSEFVLGLRRSVISIQNTAAAASATAGTDQEVETISQLLDVLSQSSPPWFLSQSHGMGTIVPIIMLTPILLREVISIIWVVSDVLSLALTSSSGGILGKFCQGILSTARSILDTFMSLVISSDDQWKKADSFQRQRTLARLVSQTSLVLELIVGVVLFGDAIQAFWGFSFGGSGAVLGAPRLPLKIVVGKMVCAHLYINFLLSRRRKIHALVGSIRSFREKNN